MSITIRAGKIVGRDHLVRQANCQDALAVAECGDQVIAGVCDGCGEGARSEVGAALAADFIVTRASEHIEAGKTANDLPSLLYWQTLAYLEQLLAVAGPANRVQFAHDYLLFTILGAVLTPDGGVIFSAGDGQFAIDDHVTEIDQRNRPAYIAYQLFTAELGTSIPVGFSTTPISAGWSHVAVMTDGFEADLLPQIWDIAHPRGLQRKLNAWSNQQHRFADDTAIITIERA